MQAVVLFLLLWQNVYTVSDAGMGVLLSFVYHLLKITFQISPQPKNSICDSFPRNIPAATSMMSGEANFHCYVVCPKCHAMYDSKACSEVSAGFEVSKTCQHIEFPNHCQTSRRNKCGADLLQRVKIGGKYKLKPFKIYCYNSLAIGEAA